MAAEAVTHPVTLDVLADPVRRKAWEVLGDTPGEYRLWAADRDHLIVQEPGERTDTDIATPAATWIGGAAMAGGVELSPGQIGGIVTDLTESALAEQAAVSGIAGAAHG